MKNKNCAFYFVAFVLPLLIFLGSFTYVVFLHPEEFGEKRPDPRSILKKKGLEIAWEWDGNRISSKRNYLLTVEKNLFFLGNLEKKLGTYYFVISGQDGKMLANHLELGNPIDFATDGSSIYVSSMGNISSYDTLTWKKMWERELDYYKHVRFVQYVNSEIQTYSYFNTFYRIDAINGEIISKNGENSTPDGDNLIRYNQGYYFSIGHSILLMMDETEKIIWKQTIPYNFDEDPPVFSGDIIYVSTYGSPNRIYAIEQSTGRILWKTKPNVISNIAASPKRVYFLTEDGILYGVRPGDAKVEVLIQFSGEKINSNSPSPIAYDPDLKNVYVLLGDSGQLFAFHETR